MRTSCHESINELFLGEDVIVATKQVDRTKLVVT